VKNLKQTLYEAHTEPLCYLNKTQKRVSVCVSNTDHIGYLCSSHRNICSSHKYVCSSQFSQTLTEVLNTEFLKFTDIPDRFEMVEQKPELILCCLQK
jgi:hypothetical protein